MRRAAIILLVITALILLLTGCPGKKELTVTLTMLEPVGQGVVEPAIGDHSYLVAPKKLADAELSAEPAEGWEFEKWEVNGEFYSDEAETTLDMNADKTVQAFFKEVIAPPEEYTLTADKVGEGTIEVDDEEAELPFEQDYVGGTQITLNAIPAEGWQFDKWVIDGEDVLDAETAVTINADVDAVAHFTQIPGPLEYTLTVDKAGEGTIEVAEEEAELPFEQDYVEGTQITLNAIPAEGWQFDKWVIDGEDALDAETVVTMDADVAAVAHFTQIPGPLEYTLTVDKEGEGTVEIDEEEVELPYEQDYVEGTQITLNAIPAEGWQFDKWVIDGEDAPNAETVVTMDADVDAVAHFSEIPPDEFTLTMLDPEGEGTVTPEPGVYTHVEDEEVTLLAEAADGWAFEKWVVNEEEFFMEELIIDMDEDKTAQAFFVEIPPDHYTIRFVYPGPGKGYAIRHPVGPTYEEGTEVLLTAFPNKCSEFKNWGGDASGIYFQTTITMDSDKTVYVFFDKKTYTLAISVEGEGDVTKDPEKDKYFYGETVQLTPVPDSCWEFDEWQGDLTGSDIPGEIVMDKNKEVTAVFTEIPPANVLGTWILENHAPELWILEITDQQNGIFSGTASRLHYYDGFLEYDPFVFSGSVTCDSVEFTIVWVDGVLTWTDEYEGNVSEDMMSGTWVFDLGGGVWSAYRIDDPVVNLDKETDYQTINAAIGEADPDDRVVVFPGTYAENVVVDVAGLHFWSVEKHLAVVKPLAGHGVVVEEQGAGVRIERFEINMVDAVAVNTYGIWLKGASYGSHVGDNTMTGSGAIGTSGYHAIQLSIHGGDMGIVLEFNAISGFRRGVQITGDGSSPKGTGIIVRNSTFSNNDMCLATSFGVAGGHWILDNVFEGSNWNGIYLGDEYPHPTIVILGNTFGNMLWHEYEDGRNYPAAGENPTPVEVFNLNSWASGSAVYWNRFVGTQP